MFATAVVLAAGRGSRLRSRVSKPLLKINSQAIVIYSLLTLDACADIKEIVVVVNQENSSAITREIQKRRLKKVRKIVEGGRRRQDSLGKALKAVDESSDFVLIHDAARPFIDKKIISDSLKAAKKTGAAVAAVPIKGTIKKIESRKSKTEGLLVQKTLDRGNLWEVQTPQVFKKYLIQEAYERFGDQDVTDDASLIEKLGRPVRIVRGSYFNIKITTPEDLVLAEAIARQKNGLSGRRRL